MSISIKDTINLFNYLKTGDNDKFFPHVADNVLWTVMGTHKFHLYYSPLILIQFLFTPLPCSSEQNTKQNAGNYQHCPIYGEDGNFKCYDIISQQRKNAIRHNG